MCKMLADVHEAEQIQPATCLPLIDLGLTGHSRRTKLSFFPFMNLPPTDDLALMEPFKYCLEDFVSRRGNPCPPSPPNADLLLPPFYGEGDQIGLKMDEKGIKMDQKK